MNQKNAKFNANNVGVGVLGDSHIEGKTQKGITLIALVITIIVLLILAGVTINMVLGDDGIIANAQKAKKANEESADREAVELAKGEATLLKHVGQEALSFEEAQKTFTTLTEDTYKNGVAKVVDGVPIPIGFAHVQGTTKDEGLIVVDGYGNEFVWVPVDTSENNDTPMFVKNEDGNYTGNLYDWENWTGTGSPTKMDSKYNEPRVGQDDIGNFTDNMQDEYNAMAKSVEIYGGFYIGRYETSWTGTKVASVPNVNPMTDETDLGSSWTDIYRTWNDNKNEATWYGLYAKQKELYNKENDSVVSGMIYGSQWDAIMNWMKDIENPYAMTENKLYILDSVAMGNNAWEQRECPLCTIDKDLNCSICNGEGVYSGSTNYVVCEACDGNYKSKCICYREDYCDNCEGFGNCGCDSRYCDICGGIGYVYCEACGGNGYWDESIPRIETGSCSAYKVKNVYDLSGNYSEWTQEGFGSTHRCMRGGGANERDRRTGILKVVSVC